VNELKKKNVECSGCGNSAPATQQENYPDNGWVMPFDSFGYYGGFDDNIDWLFNKEESRQWILCHDCVVRFLQLFPRLHKSIGKALHPCESDTPCCEWAWKGTDSFGQYEKDEDGKLAPANGVNYYVADKGKWVKGEES
jgi:hypothetical protein